MESEEDGNCHKTLDIMGSDKLPINWCRISSINSIKGSQLHKVEIKRFDLFVIFQVKPALQAKL